MIISETVKMNSKKLRALDRTKMIELIKAREAEGTCISEKRKNDIDDMDVYYLLPMNMVGLELAEVGNYRLALETGRYRGIKRADCNKSAPAADEPEKEPKEVTPAEVASEMVHVIEKQIEKHDAAEPEKQPEKASAVKQRTARRPLRRSRTSWNNK